MGGRQWAHCGLYNPRGVAPLRVIHFLALRPFDQPAQCHACPTRELSVVLVDLAQEAMCVGIKWQWRSRQQFAYWGACNASYFARVQAAHVLAVAGATPLPLAG